MPDGLLCLLAFLIAAAVATPQVTTRLQPLLMLGSMLAGLVTLNILPALPPASAADRFLCLLPLLALADCCRTTNTRRFTTLPNMLVLTAIVPTVLFRSVWLIQPASQTILGITPTGWLLLLGLTPLPVALALILQRLAARRLISAARDGKDGRVVSSFITQALMGRPLTVFGDGKQSRSFCYVDDLVEGLVRVASVEPFEGPVKIGRAHV